MFFWHILYHVGFFGFAAHWQSMLQYKVFSACVPADSIEVSNAVCGNIAVLCAALF